MLIKMRESKGFTLVELMIVVAIIGILAAVAIPYYQRYVQKAKMQKFVFPTLHIYQTNISTAFAVQDTMPGDIPGLTDGDTKYISSATWTNPNLLLRIKAGPGSQMLAFDGKTLVTKASLVGPATNRKLKWVFMDDRPGLAKDLGLR